MGKYTAETPHCGEVEDVEEEEERGREKLQTDKEAGVFPSGLLKLTAENPLLISTAGRDKSKHTACLTSDSVIADVSSDFTLFQTSFNQSVYVSVLPSLSLVIATLFPQVRPPSGNEKTGARQQMFGEVIDLR